MGKLREERTDCGEIKDVFQSRAENGLKNDCDRDRGVHYDTLRDSDRIFKAWNDGQDHGHCIFMISTF